MTKGFLPISKKEMEERNIKQFDFICVTGDAYVDHPSFGTAIISRVVEAEGYTSEINCTMTASDNEGNYIESKIELNIDWNSSVFNAETGIFFVNDCNFHLQKATKK